MNWAPLKVFDTLMHLQIGTHRCTGERGAPHVPSEKIS